MATAESTSTAEATGTLRTATSPKTLAIEIIIATQRSIASNFANWEVSEKLKIRMKNLEIPTLAVR
jgi:hypothetical protein